MLLAKFLLLAAPLAAAVDHLTAVGSTSVQIVFSYTAPSAAACTVEASKESDYSPLAPDVDPALFPGAALDSRSGNLSTGRHRVFVLGKQGPAAIETALNGYTLSRALQADTDYYIRVNCGGETATLTARTANIALGDPRGEPLAVDSSRPWSYKQVTRNKIANPEFADPYTGAWIQNPANVMGFAYSTSTAVSGVAGCNITLTGVKGACRFTDAAGSGWTATSGTLTDAIQADDNNFVEYSGTGQEKLFVRLGPGRFPTHGTYGAILASQNLAFSAKTTDANGDGGYARVCLTEDGQTCMSPPQRISLTTTKAVYTVCHDSPCTVKDAPGDVMVDTPQGTTPAPARVYNVSGSLNDIRFAGAFAQPVCDSMYVGESFWVYDSRTNGDSPYLLTITAKNCQASPPQVTVSQTYDLTHSGTSGVTMWRFGGPTSSNARFGILIWKESTTSASTIQVDLALWRATFAPDWRISVGAGGFGKNCQSVPTGSGHYLCMGGYDANIIFGIKPTPNGLDIKNFGFANWRGDLINPNLMNTGFKSGYSSSTNNANWDDAIPGVFYMIYQWNGGVAHGNAVLVKMTLSLTTPATPNPDDVTGPPFGSRMPLAGLASAVILTPCLNSCSSPSDNFTLTAQRKAFSQAWVESAASFPSCELQAVQGLTVIETCLNGGQDSYAWVFAYDLGNRLPVGGGFVGSQGGNTSQIFGGFMTGDTPSCRWCALHTYQNPVSLNGTPFALLEMTNKCQLTVTGGALSACSATASGGTCSACPAVTLDGYDYTGKNMCSTLTLSSSWNPAWGAQPAAFESGDPVDAVCGEAPNLYWLQKLKPGDFLFHGNEYVRLLEKVSNAEWKVIRGWGGIRDSSVYGAKSHAAGSVWLTKCGSIIKDPVTSSPLHGYALAWYFGQDPLGQDENYAFLNKFQNHGLNARNFGVELDYSVAQFDFNNPAANKAALNNTTYVQLPYRFAGKDSFCFGNSCEKHPSMGQVAATGVDASWFADVHPRLFIPSGNNAVVKAAGKTYIYKYTGSAAIDPKQYDIEVFSGRYPFRRVDTLSDSAAETGNWCVAILANDCFSGSEAGKLYFVSEAFDPTFIPLATCRESQFGVTNGDFCAGNSSSASATVTQWKLPSGNSGSVLNGQKMRAVSKEWRSYREAATENAKIDPLGKALLARGHWYIAPPPLAGEDSRNRATFAPVEVSLAAVPPGTATAWIEFGYDEQLRCSRNRGEVCVAQTQTLNESVPFLFSHEGPAGIACASGCTITIPALHNRVLYWRARYRDGSGATIGTGILHVQTVN